MINNVIANNPGVATTMTAGGTAPSVPGGSGGVLIVDTPNMVSIFTSAAYQYFVIDDGTVGGGAGSATVRGGGAPMEQVILGTRTITFNANGGSGTVIGGDGNKTIDIGTGTDYAIFTGAGSDVINLASSAATGRNTVEAAGAPPTGQNTITLGAAPTEIRSTGKDSIVAGAGAATIQVVGSAQDTVVGGSGAMTFIDGTADSRVNFSMTSTAPNSTGAVTAIGGSGGGYYKGGASGANLLIGSQGAVTLQGAGPGDVLIATGNSGIQFLQAGAGNETLLGSLSTTNNYFVAGSGANLIVAGAGNDTIYAGTGASTVTGGGGSDMVVVDAVRSRGGQVTITDFTPGTDVVHLTNYGNPNTPANLAAAAQRVGTGSRVTLSDGTTITFAGIATVSGGFFG